LCPGLNNVTRSLFLELHYGYGVSEALGFRGGYSWLDPDWTREPVKISRALVEGIHQKGGTILTSSRGLVDNDCGLDNLVARGINILFTVSGGGGPGLMQAANEGAHSIGPKALKRSVGIRVELPFEQEINPFVGQAYEHRTFFSRLHHFMIISDAFVVVPGGIGTLLELSLAWQLLQVRKLYNTPLILVGKIWAELVEWSRRSMLRKGNELASEIDFTIPHCVNTIDECVALIRENRAAWLATQPAAK
jgi:predicted Rossmann-fold nucleotide-binding protein